MEFELEFRIGPWPYGQSFRDTLKRLSARPEVRRGHLHHRCFVAWEFERTQVGRGRAARRPSGLIRITALAAREELVVVRSTAERA